MNAKDNENAIGVAFSCHAMRGVDVLAAACRVPKFDEVAIFDAQRIFFGPFWRDQKNAFYARMASKMAF